MVDMSFEEQSSIEVGFAPVFDSDIAPELDALERRRRTALRKSRARLATAAGIGLALGGGLAALAGSLVPLFVLGILGLLVGAILAGIAQSPFRGAVADLVMPRVCHFLGDMTYTANGRDAFPVGAMCDLGLVRKHTSARLRHLLIGRWRDTDFRMVHARLTSRSGTSSSTSSSRTVFEGLLFCVSVPVSAPTRIVIGRDYGDAGNALAGLLGSKGGRWMPLVTFDNARFAASSRCMPRIHRLRGNSCPIRFSTRWWTSANRKAAALARAA